MPWILVNKVYSKMHKFSNFHDKWRTDRWRDNKNVKTITNKENNNAIQANLIKKFTKNQID